MKSKFIVSYFLFHAFYFINRKTKGRISIDAHVILNVDWHGSPDEIVIVDSVGNGVGRIVDIQERKETYKRPRIERCEVYTPALLVRRP